MSSTRTYLDYNATAPLRPQARAAMLGALDLVGNASSVHAEGRLARATVETAREQVALLVGVRPEQVVFTSGATESNNWAMSAGWDRIVLSGIEHESVLAPARASGAEIVEVGCRADGRVVVEAMTEQVRRLGRALSWRSAPPARRGPTSTGGSSRVGPRVPLDPTYVVRS